MPTTSWLSDEYDLSLRSCDTVARDPLGEFV